MSEADEYKFKVDDQWYYRGNRSPTWLFVASRPDGSCQDGICEKVPNVMWPLLNEIGRLLQVQGEREWRPIETAPKDGTKIDLLYPYPRGRTINCYWMEKLGFGWVWRSPTWEGGELLPEDQWEIGSYPNMTPTHWMPVPKPRPRGETMTDRKQLKELRNAIADYMYNSGCGCCGHKAAMKEAEQRLGKLLRVPKYKDGSGYDFSKFRTRSGG